jgi:hypothetical protein
VSDHLIAAAAGAGMAAIWEIKEGWIVFLQTLITGFVCSFYLSESVILILSEYIYLTIAGPAAYFLVARYGAVATNRAAEIIKTWHILR